MINIYDAFVISRGTRVTKRDQQAGTVPFITAGSKDDGFKQKISNSGLTLYENCITVDMFGFVKYRNYSFFCDDNIIVLKPKREYSDVEMVYFSLYLAQQTKNKYDYGRQCRLKNIENLEIPSPEEIPSWVYEMEIPTFDDVVEAKSPEKVELPPASEWKSFKYSEIFDLTKGKGPSATEAKHSPGEVPYVGASAENNGITLYSSHKPAHQGNVITIATDGSVGEAFYQLNAFNATSNIMVITIKNHKMTPSIAMFLITLFKQEKSKFNYGRKWGLNRMKDSIISLPVDITGQPDWQLMENYINSLPYSKYL